MITVNDVAIKDVNSQFIIPPKPQILTDLSNLAKQEDPSLFEAGEIVAKDVGISSAILKIINSPLYGLSRTISDIKQGVMFIGWDGLQNLVQGLKLKEAYALHKSCICLERFWDNTTEIAEVSMLIGNRLRSRVPVENLYLLGLFHDCGVPAMAIKYSDYRDTLEKSNRDFSNSIVTLEDELYFTNHAVVGYYLANSWNLPKDICELILRHHDLEYLYSIDGSTQQICYSVLKLAETLVYNERRYSSSRDWPFIMDLALEVLGLTEHDYSDLKEDVSDMLVNKD
mgnify:CR=1 FL=1